MAFIKLISVDGEHCLVNRYFLQLYNDFFQNLMDDHPNDDVILIFAEESYSFIESFVNNVNNKHKNCSTFSNLDCEKSESLFLNFINV